ncbi:MAG TPA: hypothetical protein VEI97_17790 [bacterium]|nr:hypothetical protein [bacterium]
MKKPLICSLLATLALAVAAPGAMAESLDDYLKPRCGVEDQFPLDRILATYGDEIVARAQGFLMLEPTAENNNLIWMLGLLRTQEALTLSARIVEEGNPDFRRMSMGAVSFRPDWPGVMRVLDGADDPEEMTRDSATSVLADIDFSASVFQGKGAPTHRDAAVARLRALAAAETNARLKGNLQTALAHIQQQVSGS